MATKKYLDSNGLLYFWTKVKVEIDKKLTATSSDKTKWNTAATNAAHSNRTSLDKITEAKLTSWDTAATNAEHTNRDVLDSITSDVITNASSGAALATKLTNADTLKNISSTKVTNWDSAHTISSALSDLQDNVTYLKMVTADKVDEWNNGGTTSHTHANKSTIDSITSADVTKLQALYTKANIDTLLAACAKKTDLTTVYKPVGQINASDFADLTPSQSILGNVYNVSEPIQITDYFVEGVSASGTGDSDDVGKYIPTGSNIVCIKVGTIYRWDILGGVVDLSPYAKDADLQSLSNTEIDSVFTGK